MVQQYDSYRRDMSHTKIIETYSQLMDMTPDKCNGRACEIHNDVTYDRKIVIGDVQPHG